MITKRNINTHLRSLTKELNKGKSISESKIRLTIETSRDNIKIFGASIGERSLVQTISKMGYIYLPTERVNNYQKGNRNKIIN